MKKQKKNYVAIALVILLLALAVGYAAFSSTLTINGTATGTGKWDVHFKTVRLVDSTGSVDTKHGTVEELTGNKDTATAKITLAYPGDGVILEAVVENTGTVDAKLTNFTVTGADDADIEITAARPTTDEVLTANGGTCTAQFAIKWKTDSTKTDLGEKTFTVTYNYEQNTTEVNLAPVHK